MKRDDRTAWRIAARVCHALHQQRQAEQRERMDRLRPAAELTQRLPVLVRRLDKAVIRGWDGAARRLTAQLRRVRDEAEAELAALQRTMHHAPAAVPSLRELVAELNQLEEEFGDWRYDRSEAALCAVTEPIELEGVALGPFQIRLLIAELPELARRRPYEVVALEPNPAAGSPQVTHPHVADEKLCEGEAASSIRAALAAGRLCEFFLLVRAVLSHYNPSSPYVTLDEWNGEPCTECGDRVNSDERGLCERCEAVMCDACGETCADCQHLFCPACLTRCEQCDDRLCAHCLDRCAGCERRCCAGCLEDDLCADCREQQEEDQEYEQDDNEDQNEQQRHEQPGAPRPEAAPAPLEQ